jgi:hypothetical protein
MASVTPSGVWITNAKAGVDYDTRLFAVLFPENCQALQQLSNFTNLRNNDI